MTTNPHDGAPAGTEAGAGAGAGATTETGTEAGTGAGAEAPSVQPPKTEDRVPQDRLVGLVVGGRTEGCAALLAAFAVRRKAEGVRVGGIIQRPQQQGERSRLVLEDIETGALIPLTQDLGSGSTACSLDPGQLMAGAMVIRRGIEAGVELILVNKFARLEAEGGGLLAEIYEAIAAGIPLLITIAPDYLSQWAMLSGAVGTRLAPEEAVLENWWRQAQAG